MLPEVAGVDVGERKKDVWEIGKDGTHCKCTWKVKSTDRICPNCGVFLSRDGEILPVRENKPPVTSKQTETFVSKGAVKMQDSGGGGEEARTRPDWEIVGGGEDPPVRMDAGAVRAALKRGVLIRKKKGPPLK